MDPAKLKVADLRNELSARGLDVKGTKPILVKRLKDALEKELNKELPNTSIADTSSEDLDSSKPEISPRKSLRSSTDEKEEAKVSKSAPAVAVDKSKAVEKVDKPPQEKPQPVKPAPQAVSQPVKPATQPAKPAAQPAKPTTQPAKPTTQPAKPATQPAKPATQPVQSAAQAKAQTQPAKATTEAAKPGVQQVKPSTQAAKPAVQPAKPAVQPAKPAVQAAKPAVQPAKPAVQSAKPAVQPAKPGVQPAKPVVTAVKPGTQPAKPGAPAPQLTKPAAQSGTQVTKPETQAAKPVSQPTKPIAPTTKPATQPVKPAQSAAAVKSADTLKTEAKPHDEPKTEAKPPDKQSPEKPKTVAKSPEKSKAGAESTEKQGTNLDKGAESPAKKLKLDENGEQSDQVTPMEVQEEADKDAKTDEDTKTEKGEKRKRSSDSPERPSKRARTPIEEDEPEINADAVQLSWYDSDLHLQVDKSTFLSAKPLTEGAFGFLWAGARATHGISNGKVCYEVKITEKLEWEDGIRPDNRNRQDYRRSRRDDRRRSRSRSRNRDRSRRDSEKSKDDSKKSKDVPEKSKDDSDKSQDDSEKPKDDSEKTQDSDKPKEDDSEKPKDDSEKPKEDSEKLKEDSEKPKVASEPMDVTSNNKEDENKTSKTDVEESAKKTDEPMDTNEDKTEEGDKKSDADEKKAGKDEKPVEPLPTHFFRVGWSVQLTSLQLGEDKNSFGYESSGKFVKNKEFSDYGIAFNAGDVIGAYVDISATAITMQFSVNGQLQPSIEIPKDDLPEDFVLFPHILSRNFSFEVNFGEKEEPWFAIPFELSGYQFLSKVEDKKAGPTRPENRTDCEVILMCGLPASGKTHWVKEHVASNLDKMYTIIGNTSFFERMTISGEPLKSKFKGRWSVVVDKLQKCVNKLVFQAATRRKNVIIDQTNVFPSAQRRKMRPFEGFKRKAVIVIVGDEEQARRQAFQEALDGKEIPDSTLLEMKATITLPEICDWLEEIEYVGVDEAEAKEIVTRYNAAGKAAGYGSDFRSRRDNRWNYNRNDRGGKNYQRDGGYNRQPYHSRDKWGSSRHGGGGGGGGWKQDSRSRDWRSGGYSRDRDYYSQGGYRSRNEDSGSRSGGGQRWGSSGGSGGWGGGYGGQSERSGGGSSRGGGWNQQNFGRSYNQNWGGGQRGGGSWGGKYGSSGSGGGGQSYGNSWNYYGQGQQNWSGQGQQQAYQQYLQHQQQQQQYQQQLQQQAGFQTANAAQNQPPVAQSYNTQEAWAQYAKQYAQHQQMVQKQAAAANQMR